MAQGAGPERPGEERSGLISRLRGDGAGRSSFVYIVVGIVAITLTVLLAIIYFSASERERTSPPICTDITLETAERAILEGRVERLTVVYDDGPVTPTSARYGPVLAKLDFTDGTCSNLPQGVAHQGVVYTVAGVIAFYNENTDDQQVDIVYQTSANLPENLFAPPTEIPTDVPTVAPTEPPPTEAATVPPTSEPTITPVPTSTSVPATPVGAGTPGASPAPLPVRAASTPAP